MSDSNGMRPVSYTHLVHLTVTAKRLKEDLSPIPGLVIESARGKGYSLKIVSGE